MELKIGAVEEAAMQQNGWHAIAIQKDRHRSGTVPHGEIAFVRIPVDENESDRLEERGRCGTASWAINDLGIFFYAGHYDLRRDDAMEDFTRRVVRQDALVA